MIKKFSIRDYKSIDEINLNLSKLNIFTGPNSSGKSSAIQAFLLGADNVEREPEQHRVRLRHFNIPSFRESRNFIKNAKEYEISLNDVSLIFMPEKDDLTGIIVDQKGVLIEKDYKLLKDHLLYLPAMRNADISTTNINPAPDYNKLGLSGEFVIDYFIRHKDLIVPNDIILEDDIVTLGGQLNYWLKKLTGYTIKVILDGSEYKARYEILGKEIHPHHVGTGVSFITGILIVCLISVINKGIAIIENPEIHLHPAAQAELINFIALISNADGQILVETHSDHLFNGIRRLLHLDILKTNNLRVFNFRKEIDGTSSVSNIEFNQDGSILNYEPGLFEQFDKDLDVLLS